jgi:two-component sensor histidine kinase
MDDVSGPGAPSDDDGGAPRIVRLEEQVAALRAELRAAQERERQLAGALQNRVRNNLAALRSIFSRTVDAGTDLVEVADHFRGRMDAIGRYQLGAGDFALRGFDLDAIVRDELIVFATDQARIDIGGPPVRLNDRTAEAMALGVHELATNSIKFGVLGDPGGGGKLSVRWTVHDERRRARTATLRLRARVHRTGAAIPDRREHQLHANPRRSPLRHRMRSRPANIVSKRRIHGSESDLARLS